MHSIQQKQVFSTNNILYSKLCCWSNFLLQASLVSLFFHYTFFYRAFFNIEESWLTLLEEGIILFDVSLLFKVWCTKERGTQVEKRKGTREGNCCLWAGGWRRFFHAGKIIYLYSICSGILKITFKKWKIIWYRFKVCQHGAGKYLFLVCRRLRWPGEKAIITPRPPPARVWPSSLHFLPSW